MINNLINALEAKESLADSNQQETLVSSRVDHTSKVEGEE